MRFTIFILLSLPIIAWGVALNNAQENADANTILKDSMAVCSNDTLSVYPDSAGTSELINQNSDSLHWHTDSLDTRVAVPRQDSLEAETKPIPTFRTWKNNAFGVGEELLFDVSYGLIKAGSATMSIPDTVWRYGRPCYRILTTARSASFFDVFFKVRDKVQTIIDMQGIFPWEFEKHIREGGYESDRYVTYDQINQKVYYKKDTLKVPPYIQGVLSSFYYVRTLDLKVGKHFDIDNYGDGKIYPLRVLVHRKQTINVPAGKFKCIVVEPVLRTEGIFNQKGKLTIWLTDDERKIPVLMKSEVLIGSISVKLKEIRSE